jgi:UDP-glucose 4-epimerase
MRTLQAQRREALGIDVLPGAFTHHVGSITERAFVHRCMKNITTVLHAATLHKPHVATHSRQDFVDVNISGTLNLLEEATATGVKAFVCTSTTSVFGDALVPPPGEPAAWITEDVAAVPKNIYGVTKAAAEDLCQMFARNHALRTVVLRTSRFFPEEDDNRAVREVYADANIKTNEFLHRRVDIEDVVSAHLLALEKAPDIGFARYIVSGTTPFTREDLEQLRTDAPAVVRRHHPEYEEVYAARGWRMFPAIERVYVNHKAREELGWRPRHDFGAVLERVRAGEDHRSALAREVGAKGYHAETTGVYTTR